MSSSMSSCICELWMRMPPPPASQPSMTKSYVAEPMDSGSALIFSTSSSVGRVKGWCSAS